MPDLISEERLKQIDQAWKDRIERAQRSLSPARQVLVQVHPRTWAQQNTHPQEVQALEQALSEGMKPSAYVAEKMPWLCRDLVEPECLPVLLDALDRLLEIPYDTQYDRRSFRSSAAKVYLQRIRAMLFSFCSDTTLAHPLTVLLEGRVPVMDASWAFVRRTGNTLPWRIARALDAHEEAVEALVRTIILGEGEQRIIRYALRGVLLSRREDLYPLVGKLLVAARLQEGLRGAICEMADQCQLGAMLHLIDVIAENDLIRFSGVKRAVGCWLGLISEETHDLERVSQKSMQLIRRCLRDGAFLNECLRSEDAMQLYIALWAIGVRDVSVAAQAVLRLAKEGTHHQVMVAGVFLSNLNMPALQDRVCVAVCLSHPEEMDVQAVYLRQLGQQATDILYAHHALPAELEKAPNMAARFCRHLLALRKKVGKGLTFSPCVFPWHEEKLTRAMIAANALAAARASGDESLLDACMPLLAECEPALRENALASCYGKPRNAGQRELVLRSICDKSDGTRRKALEIVKKWTLTDADYAIIVDLLRYRYGDVRPGLNDLLMRQGDDALYRSVQTLLDDKNEERRLAGMSIVKEMAEDNTRPALARRLNALIEGREDETDKAAMVRRGIRREAAQLYAPEDLQTPELALTPALQEAVDCFARYFPDTAIPGEMKGSLMQKVKGLLTSGAAALKTDARLTKSAALTESEEDLRSLIDLYRQNLLTPVPEREGKLLNSLNGWEWRQTKEIPLHSVWENWCRERLGSDPVRIVRLHVLVNAEESSLFHPVLTRAIGAGWATLAAAQREFGALNGKGHPAPVCLDEILRVLVESLMQDEQTARELHMISTALLCWIALHVDADDLYRIDDVGWRCVDALMRSGQIRALTAHIMPTTGELLRLNVSARWHITRAGQPVLKKLYDQTKNRIYVGPHGHRETCLPIGSLLHAVLEGLLPVRALYAWLVEVADLDSARALLALSAYYRAGGRDTANRRSWRNSLKQQQRYVNEFLGHEYGERAEDSALLARVDELAQPLLNAIVDAEIHRGDADTPYTPYVGAVARLEGAENFVMLLTALGRDKLVRHESWSSNGRAASISQLLSTCVPAREDTADRLRALIAENRLTRARMIEAALYCPEWLPLLEEALGIPGLACAAWYFIAHMKDETDPVRQAWIARYTPLSCEDLAAGAFDLDWFRRAYAEVGGETFDLLYAAAKYIGAGSRHARGRRFADAALGRITCGELADHIINKRNQDSLMAYGIVPLTGEDDLRARYLFIQQFLKESRKFGAQRIASEKVAAAMALTNLARSAGYADATRLTLRMEAGLMAELRPLTIPQTIGDVSICLTVDASGKADVRVEKAGKTLKAIPAKIKKDPAVVQITEAKKQLIEQQKRARAIFETAMEDETAFTVGELRALMESEVLAPMLRAVVLLHGEESGLLDGPGLITCDGRAIPLADAAEVRIAHPCHLHAAGAWLPWQRKLFAGHTVQPFRQVFRELYVPTADEKPLTVSPRYAGYQVQPGRAAACLRTRRWVADPEIGLQKVDHRRNVVAVMLAMADWFTPADIEAPTLEGVAFLDRLTGKPMPVKDVPPVLFSEVMRDIDLAVSVAHAGGVDPEASHATIEMREALLALTLPLFRLTNVEIRDRHAIIAGKLADYTVHLGSGVAHQVGGTMLNILPVHSAHRGRIFLPFADDDPQTAEVLTKILLLAEDGKLKDPTILEQIRMN